MVGHGVRHTPETHLRPVLQSESLVQKGSGCQLAWQKPSAPQYSPVSHEPLVQAGRHWPPTHDSPAPQSEEVVHWSVLGRQKLP